MDHNRNGEKWGWIGGWVGSFLWMPMLGTVILVQRGALWTCMVAFFCSVAAFFSIFFFAPWKHPNTRMWKLMFPLYVLLVIGAVMMILSYEGIRAKNLLPLLPGLLPIFMPVFIIGRRCWLDGETKNGQ